MVVETEKTFGIGSYWTAEGQPAVVDAITDGMLIGRVDIQDRPDGDPIWWPVIWRQDGRCHSRSSGKDDLRTFKIAKIACEYWLNIYTSGPGQLRKTWEESLIEASRCEEDVLCRVKVPVKAFVGEGLK